MRRSTDPHDLARGQRQGYEAKGDGVTPRVTPFYALGCHPQVGGIIQEFAKDDGVTGSRISRCAREAHTLIVNRRWCVEALSRVGDCAGCHPVILHVMCRCFADLRVTPVLFSRVSPRHPGCHPGVIRPANADAPSLAMPDDGSSGRVATRQRPSSVRPTAATHAATSQAPEAVRAPAAAPSAAAVTLRFTAPTVAREDWCA